MYTWFNIPSLPRLFLAPHKFFTYKVTVPSVRPKSLDRPALLKIMRNSRYRGLVRATKKYGARLSTKANAVRLQRQSVFRRIRKASYNKRKLDDDAMAVDVDDQSMPGLMRSSPPFSSSSRSSSESLLTPPQFTVGLHPQYCNPRDGPYYPSWIQPSSYESYLPGFQQSYVPTAYHDEDVDMIDVVNDKVVEYIGTLEPCIWHEDVDDPMDFAGELTPDTLMHTDSWGDPIVPVALLEDVVPQPIDHPVEAQPPAAAESTEPEPVQHPSEDTANTVDSAPAEVFSEPIPSQWSDEQRTALAEIVDETDLGPFASKTELLDYALPPSISQSLEGPLQTVDSVEDQYAAPIVLADVSPEATTSSASTLQNVVLSGSQLFPAFPIPVQVTLSQIGHPSAGIAYEPAQTIPGPVAPSAESETAATLLQTPADLPTTSNIVAEDQLPVTAPPPLESSSSNSASSVAVAETEMVPPTAPTSLANDGPQPEDPDSDAEFDNMAAAAQAERRARQDARAKKNSSKQLSEEKRPAIRPMPRRKGVPPSQNPPPTAHAEQQEPMDAQPIVPDSGSTSGGKVATDQELEDILAKDMRATEKEKERRDRRHVEFCRLKGKNVVSRRKLSSTLNKVDAAVAMSSHSDATPSSSTVSAPLQVGFTLGERSNASSSTMTGSSRMACPPASTSTSFPPPSSLQDASFQEGLPVVVAPAQVVDRKGKGRATEPTDEAHTYHSRLENIRSHVEEPYVRHTESFDVVSNYSSRYGGWTTRLNEQPVASSSTAAQVPQQPSASSIHWGAIYDSLLKAGAV